MRVLQSPKHLLAAGWRRVRAIVGPWRVQCPICGWRFREFLPFGKARGGGIAFQQGPYPRRNAICPRCYSAERHRLIYLFLQRRTRFFEDDMRVLHFAPERAFRLFSAMPNLTWITADLESPDVHVRLDITTLPLKDESFDAVLCSHVLEHVSDDRMAMREILRVMKPGGWAILMVPFQPGREVTLEDPSITDPDERERVYGQRDHQRLYGSDYPERLRQAGFTVVEDRLAFEIDADRYGLVREPVYLCIKPRVAAFVGDGAIPF